MQSMEQRRQQVEEEEIRRRKELNSTLDRGNYGLTNFMRGLTGGTPFAPIMAGMGGNLAGTLGHLFAESMSRDAARWLQYRR
jgi:hypothetical protein